ncbi:MAG: potassium-transporting ATPase subunit KdpC [Eubacteriales bacterium]
MKKEIKKFFRPAVVLLLAMTLLCGIIYPAAVTGIAQVFFPSQANGSIIKVTLKDGTKADYGSVLIAQSFTSAKYLIGRPNLTGSSGPSNLSVVSDKEAALVKERVAWLKSLDPSNTADIPSDLVTVSGSGVDPNISPEAADYQAARIAGERGISEDDVRAVIAKYTTGRLLGFWGNPAVNVLKVNLALDGLI